MNKNLSIQLGAISNWKSHNYKNLINAIDRLPGVRVADVTLADLALPSDECCGIYLFQEGDNYCMLEEGKHAPNGYWYIGKNEKMCFSGRIGAHLAPRKSDFMNIVLKNIARLMSGPNNKNLNNALPILLDLRLKLVHFPPKHLKDIRAVEKALIAHYKPYLNNPNRNPRNLMIIP